MARRPKAPQLDEAELHLIVDSVVYRLLNQPGIDDELESQLEQLKDKVQDYIKPNSGREPDALERARRKSS